MCVLGFVEFCNFGATNSIDTFANPSAFCYSRTSCFWGTNKEKEKKKISRGFSRKNGLPNFLELNM
jgi:hypothetical protein